MRSDKLTTCFCRLAAKKTGILFILTIMLAAMLTFAGASMPVNAVQEDSFELLNEDASITSVLYNNTNGLPTSEANAIAQTSEGFIWIGSYGGLVRYDGKEFERMDMSYGTSGAGCLLADSRDRLWCGSNDSGLIMIYRDEVMRWNTDNGLPSVSVTNIAEDSSGNIYIGTINGMVIIDKDMKLHRLTDERLKNVYVQDMESGTDGMIYCVSKNGDVFAFRNGELLDYIFENEYISARATAVFQDKNDPESVYLGTEGYVVFHCRFDEIRNTKNGYDELNYIETNLLHNANDIKYVGDRMWLTFENGVGVLDQGSVKPIKNLHMNDKFGHIFSDHEGNTWITSSRQGVLKITYNRFIDLYDIYDMPDNVVNSTCIFDDKLFIGTDAGMTILDKDGAVDSFLCQYDNMDTGTSHKSNMLKVFDGMRVRSVVKDSRNRLWICSWNVLGLMCYDNGHIFVFNALDNLPSERVRTVYERKDGSLLVAVTGGVSIINNNKVVRNYGEDDGIKNTEILTVCEDAGGNILAGSDGGGIYVINDKGVRNLTKSDGLASDTILRLKPDRRRDITWVITSNSIGYITPELEIKTISTFPYRNNFDLYQNSSDEMWVLSSNGIYIVPTENMISDNAGIPALYTIADGLPCIATANSYSCLTDSGDLYIAGNTGVVKVNIEKSAESVKDYKASVPYIAADDKKIYPDENGNFTISSDIKKITIYGYVFSYSFNSPQITYQLNGFDDKSRKVSFEDFAPVDYTNLSGGEYSFVMDITDLRGDHHQTLTVNITKQKAFYEEVWFYIIAGIAGLIVMIAVLHLIVIMSLKKLKRKHREEMEKERISTELKTASRIQNDMMPGVFPAFPDRNEFDIYAKMLPAKEVGGDFYDFFMTDDDHLCMVMADVSGKGIPAALFMMSSKIILKNFAMLGISPAEILTRTNESVCLNNKSDMFVSVWIGILEISTGRLTTANAGHEYPAIMKPDGSFELLKDKHGFVIGGMEGIKYKEYELTLEHGSKLFEYTDGVPEATNAEKTLFGTDRMIAALNEEPSASPEKILANVQKAVDSFVMDAEQFDDLTMLCLEYK